MRSVPLFSEIYILVVAFDISLVALYLNLNFFPLFFVFSINLPENLIPLMVIEHKSSTFFLNIRVAEVHCGSMRKYFPHNQ